ncbi:diphthine synthase [Desmophyllum pertusum]|uniref:diphthine methyl ester synthase n=1 Tax=Desmophyllum pertusum TaxID=174260 RepID=A0A9X0CK53_9CNID|nr:diphthine synthase [Desmophyllum pertusum]
MLYLVGLGLGDAKDITVKGLEIVKKADYVFLEAYTSILCVGKEVLEEFYGCKIQLADRETVEQNSDLLLEHAKDKDVAFLVVGDPFGATTHTDIVLRAHQLNIPYQKTGLHTLCLLDIKVKEQSVENLMRGRKVFEPPRYMSVNEAVSQLLEVVSNRDLKGEPPAYTDASIAVGLAQVGAANQQIVCGSMKELLSHDLGKPLHSLVIPGHLHFIEKDMLRIFAVNPSILDES